MHNHTDTFQPPQGGQNDMPDGKQIFGFVVSLFYLALMTLNTPWLLLMRKRGTVGTRATWFDFGCTNLLLLACRQFFPYSPCVELFTGTMLLMLPLFLLHFRAAWISPQHVHTQSIGRPWVGSELLEFVIGAAIGLTIIWRWPSAEPFGYFVLASAGALAIRSMMIEERDRMRSVQIEDALWEQEQMLANYERHRK